MDGRYVVLPPASKPGRLTTQLGRTVDWERWIFTGDEPTRKQLAAEIQQQAYQSLPIISVGQFAIPTTYRTTLSGIVPPPVIVMWNVEKKYHSRPHCYGQPIYCEGYVRRHIGVRTRTGS